MSAVHPLGGHSDFLKRHDSALTDSHIIIHDQRLQAGEMAFMFFLAVPELFILGNSQLDIHGKLCSESLDGAHGDFSIHEIHNAF